MPGGGGEAGGWLLLLDRMGRESRRIGVPRGRLTLGCSSNCDVRVPQRGVAALHADLIVQANQTLIRNHSAEGGTLVNGEPVSVATLQQNDVVRIGNRQFRWIYAVPYRVLPSALPTLPRLPDAPLQPGNSGDIQVAVVKPQQRVATEEYCLNNEETNVARSRDSRGLIAGEPVVSASFAHRPLVINSPAPSRHSTRAPVVSPSPSPARQSSISDVSTLYPQQSPRAFLASLVVSPARLPRAPVVASPSRHSHSAPVSPTSTPWPFHRAPVVFLSPSPARQSRISAVSTPSPQQSTRASLASLPVSPARVPCAPVVPSSTRHSHSAPASPTRSLTQRLADTSASNNNIPAPKSSTKRQSRTPTSDVRANETSQLRASAVSRPAISPTKRQSTRSTEASPALDSAITWLKRKSRSPAKSPTKRQSRTSASPAIVDTSNIKSQSKSPSKRQSHSLVVPLNNFQRQFSRTSNAKLSPKSSKSSAASSVSLSAVFTSVPGSIRFWASTPLRAAPVLVYPQFTGASELGCLSPINVAINSPVGITVEGVVLNRSLQQAKASPKGKGIESPKEKPKSDTNAVTEAVTLQLSRPQTRGRKGEMVAQLTVSPKLTRRRIRGKTAQETTATSPKSPQNPPTPEGLAGSWAPRAKTVSENLGVLDAPRTRRTRCNTEKLASDKEYPMPKGRRAPLPAKKSPVRKRPIKKETEDSPKKSRENAKDTTKRTVQARPARAARNNAQKAETTLYKRRSSLVITKKAPAFSPKPNAEAAKKTSKSSVKETTPKKVVMTRKKKAQAEMKPNTPKNTRARRTKTSVVITKTSPVIKPRAIRNTNAIGNTKKVQSPKNFAKPQTHNKGKRGRNATEKSDVVTETSKDRKPAKKLDAVEAPVTRGRKAANESKVVATATRKGRKVAENSVAFEPNATVADKSANLSASETNVTAETTRKVRAARNANKTAQEPKSKARTPNKSVEIQPARGTRTKYIKNPAFAASRTRKDVDDFSTVPAKKLASPSKKTALPGKKTSSPTKKTVPPTKEAPRGTQKPAAKSEPRAASAQRAATKKEEAKPAKEKTRAASAAVIVKSPAASAARRRR